jgi:hypothetical protein
MATVSDQIITVLGPIKLEVINLTAVDDGDTVSTRIQRPSFAVAFSTVDDNNTIGVIQAGISDKTLTLNNSGLSSSTVVVLVFGF